MGLIETRNRLTLNWTKGLRLEFCNGSAFYSMFLWLGRGKRDAINRFHGTERPTPDLFRKQKVWRMLRIGVRKEGCAPSSNLCVFGFPAKRLQMS